MMGFVVESLVSLPDGSGTGKAQVWVATKARAEEIIEQGRVAGVSRTYREVDYEDMPPVARDNLKRLI